MSIYTAGGPNSAFERAAARAVADVKKKMIALQKEIVAVLFDALSRPVRASSYWKGVERELARLYNEITRVYWEHAASEIPKSYTASVAQIGRQIDRTKKIAETARRSARQLAGSQGSKQIMQALLSDAVAGMDAAAAGGYRNARRITRLTQQMIIEEWTLDAAVAEAYGRGNLIGDFQRTLAARDPNYAKLLESFRGERVIQAGSKTFTPEYYAELVSRTKFHEAQAHAALQQAKNYGTDLVVVSNHNTTTAMCQYYEAKTFSISGKDKRFPILDQAPPFHPNCYSDDTEVYTKEGWKYFKDVTMEDRFLSVKMDKNLEYVRPLQLIKETSDKMIHFKSINTDILVTPGHDMYLQTDHSSKNHPYRYEFRQAQKFLGFKSGRFYASSEWKGVDSLSKDYCEFMGYYMAEGSCYKSSANTWRVTISQSKEKNPEKYARMYSCIKKNFDVHVSETSGNMVFYHPIGKDLSVLGKSYEKYIPEEIKSQIKGKIEIFLRAFCDGDGSIAKGREFKGHKFRDTRWYFTSSPKMKDDLMELILKIGKRPTLKKHGNKDKPVEHRNGIYTSSHDCFKITECHSKHLTIQNMGIEEVSYSGNVYCVTLEKNHTLWVKRNGKTVWCGNCLHLLYPVFVEAMEIDGTLAGQSAFSQGHADRPPVPAGYIPIGDRG